MAFERLENDQGDVLYVDSDTGEQLTEEEYRNRLVSDAAEADVTEQDEIDRTIPGYPHGQRGQVMTQEAKGFGAALATKIARVMGDLQRVPKDGFNEHSKYHYATESAIVDTIRPLLAKHNLAFFVAGVDEPAITEGKTRSGATNYMTTVRVHFMLLDGDSGESITVPVYGSGIDMAEKGLYVAYTAAKKYALLLTFMVSTGEDDAERGTHEFERKASGGGQQRQSAPRQRQAPQQQEEKQQTAPPEEVKPSTQNQHKRIYTYASKAGLSNDEVKEKFMRPVYGVDSAKDLQFDQAVELIQLLMLYPMATAMEEAETTDAVEAAMQEARQFQVITRPRKWIERKYNEAMERFLTQEGEFDGLPDDMDDEASSAVGDPELDVSDEEIADLQNRGE